MDRAWGENCVKICSAFAVLVLVIIAEPAHARKSFYIVRNTITNKCTVVSRLPEMTRSPSNLVVQNSTAYKSREAAESALKSVQVCADM